MLFKEFNYYKTYQYLLVAVALIIPFIEYIKPQLASIALILLFINWSVAGEFKIKWERLLQNKIVILFLLLYLVNLHGLFVPADNNIGQRVLIKKAAIFLFPLIIVTSPSLDFKFIKRVIYFFVFSLILSTLVTFSRGVEKLVLSPEGLTDLAGKITIHRPFFGLFCAFSILALLFFINRKYKVSGIILFGLVCAYLLGFILFIYAKMTLLALFVTIILVSFLWLLKRRKYELLLAIGIILLIGSGGAYLFNPQIKNYVSNIRQQKDFSYSSHNILVVGSINVRYINWGCALQILKENNNWLYGVGAGNTQARLQMCYKDINPWIYENKMNSHNQYLEETLFNGILGLILLLACFVVPGVIAYNQNNFLYLAFIIILALCCLTENILSRSVGIIFYAFFNSILFFKPKH